MTDVNIRDLSGIVDGKGADGVANIVPLVLRTNMVVKGRSAGDGEGEECRRW